MFGCEGDPTLVGRQQRLSEDLLKVQSLQEPDAHSLRGLIPVITGRIKEVRSGLLTKQQALKRCEINITFHLSNKRLLYLNGV